jgi:hypothetical protein
MPFCRLRLSAKRFIAGVGGYAASNGLYAQTIRRLREAAAKRSATAR